MGVTAIACSAIIALLADSSASVKDPEYLMMRDGHAAAFRAPEVVRAITDSDGIAVVYIEFSSEIKTRLDWRILRTARDAEDYATEVHALERQLNSTTATGDAIKVAIEAMTNAPCQSDKRMIDIVTDGAKNLGIAPQEARDLAVIERVRINALGVRTATATRNLAEWLEDTTTTPAMTAVDGTTPIPRGFAMEIGAWADFAQAIRSKISMEFADALDFLKQRVKAL